LSGIFESKSLGTPIGFIIKNNDAKPKDYSHLKDSYRPSHADFTYEKKYGLRDHRGGGRSSARETACRVVAGTLAKQLLNLQGVTISAYVSQVGTVKLNKCHKDLDLSKIHSNLARCPDIEVAKQMVAEIEKIQEKGDTIGGEITSISVGVPAGWGEPVFDKLHAGLGKAMLSINAVKGFKFGFGGVDIASSKGSEVNDIFIDNKGATKSNFSGGIQGGISNGNDIYFSVAFKPVSTLMMSQKTVNKDGVRVEIEGKGRHDPCVLPRAVPIVEAMTALVLADHYLRSKTNKI